MATPAQCIANAENAKLSTGPKTEAGKANVAKNGVQHGLFAAYERLAPADSARINEFIEELHDCFPEHCPAYETDVIRDYAIAKWRSELFYRMEASFFESAIACGRALPETSALIEQSGEGILFGLALQRDAAGPNVQSKLMRYESRVTKELKRAREAYCQVLNLIGNRAEKAKPISSPKVESSPAVPPQTPRNSPCPCGSGQKFKRCCGENAPAVLNAASVSANMF